MTPNENQKRQILVTGSSSGIGYATVENLLNHRYEVIGVSRSGSDSQFNHDHYHNFNLDLENIVELPEKLKLLVSQFSEIDGVVFCAGRGHFGSLEEFSYEQIKSLIDLNFLSQAFLAKAFVPLFKKRNRGDLIFIGSESALSGARQGSIYCASKFAIRGMAQALREECARNNIRVAIINPGMVKSAFFDRLDFEPGEEAENYIEPEDVAEAIRYILESNDQINLDEINLSPMKHVVRKKK